MKALTKLQTLLLLCCIHVVADAEPIRQGMVLPPLDIDDKGELVINGDDIEYQPWSTAELMDKVVVLQYMAARPSAQKMNRQFNDAFKAADFPRGSVLSTV